MESKQQLRVSDVLGLGGLLATAMPGYEPRPTQVEMATLIEETLDTGDNAVIEAGTGTGKSLAYMIPAVLSGKQVIISTGTKSLQGQLWEKDIPFLQGLLGGFSAALLKGRGNYLCLHHMDQLTQTEELMSRMGDNEDAFGFRMMESSAQWPALKEWAKQTTDGDIDAAPFQVTPELRESVTATSETCIGQKCPFFGQCYSEAAKARAKASRVVVVNHALLLRDLVVRKATEGFASVIPAGQVYILDEAHNLQDVATGAFGIEFTEYRTRRISQRLESLTMKHKSVKHGVGTSVETAVKWRDLMADAEALVDGLFHRLALRFLDSKGTTQELGDETALATPAITALTMLANKMLVGTPSYLTDDAERATWMKLVGIVRTYAEDLAATMIPSPERAYVRYLTFETKTRRLTVNAKPVDVAPYLRSHLWSMNDKGVSIISTSATIATGPSLKYWREQVGCDDAWELVVDSPFDYANNAMLYLPLDATDFDGGAYRLDGSPAYLDRLADRMAQLVDASNGRAFLLFTSYKTLTEVYNRLIERLAPYTLLKQGDASRPELVRRFKADGNAVLFGVKSFWEGVDMPGDCLSMVVIDKIPFTPPDDPIWKARCDHANAIKNDKWAWFNDLAIPAATINLKQGFGRLIRTGTDTGVVALLDGRLSLKSYGKRIVGSLPRATQTMNLDDVRDFFGN